MATFARVLLSGGVNGTPIKVIAVATPGTVIHTASSTANVFDEMHLWVTNTSGTAATLTIEFGSVTSPDGHLVQAYSIPANSAPILIASGQTLTGGVVVGAYSGTANVLVITGYVNRISP